MMGELSRDQSMPTSLNKDYQNIGHSFFFSDSYHIFQIKDHHLTIDASHALILKCEKKELIAYSNAKNKNIFIIKSLS